MELKKKYKRKPEAEIQPDGSHKPLNRTHTQWASQASAQHKAKNKFEHSLHDVLGIRDLRLPVFLGLAWTLHVLIWASPNCACAPCV